MSSEQRLSAILARRERLLAKCDFQREELARFAMASQGTFNAADRVLRVISFFRAHPIALVGVAAALTLLRRRGWRGWMKRVFFVWRTYRTIRQFWARPAV